MNEVSHDAMLTLRVTQAEEVAHDIHMFELRAPDGRDLPSFTPGAHVAVRVPSGVLRNYSLCNEPGDRNRYVIAVKREVDGRGGSINLIDCVKTGDMLAVGNPKNLFALDTDAPSFIFVAGGIGITPILSMVRHIKATTAKSFKLYYLTRSPEVTAFLDEVRAFKADENEVIVHHDEGNPANTYDLWPVFEEPTKAHIYCCGPRPLMDAVRDMTGHWPDHAVHFEDFGSDLVKPRPDDKPFKVKLVRSGEIYEIPVGETILEVLRSRGVKLASSCESGTCGTCKTKLLSGSADHRDLVLEPAEQADNIMICISRGTDTLELDL